MQTIDFTSAAARRTFSSDATRSGTPVKLPFSEPFDAIMGRALSHAQPEMADNVDADDDAQCGEKADQATASEPAAATETNLPAGMEMAAAPAAPRPQTNSAPAPATTAAVTSGPAGEASAGNSPANAALAALPQPAAAEGNPASAAANEAIPIPAKPDLAKELQTLSGNTQASPPPATGQQAVPAGELPPDAEGENTAETVDSSDLVSELPPASNPSGISAAQQGDSMKKAEKTDKITARAEQKLPVTPGNDGKDPSAELAQPVKIKFMQRGNGSEPAQAAGSSDSGAAVSLNLVETAQALHNLPSVEAPAPLRTLDRAQEIMSLQAVRLRETGADSLQVVIKPAPGMQLSLNLQMRDGTVEMIATLNRGDYDLLNRHWPELQQQLEARGIRLAPLNNDQPLTGDAHHFQRPDRRDAGENAVPLEGLVDLALVSNVKSAPAIKKTGLRGWESWA